MDLIAFWDAVTRLDMALTGSDAADATSTLHQQGWRGKERPEGWLVSPGSMDGVYYLSDHYSRVYWDGSALRLTPNSTVKVKEAWDRTTAEREALEAFLTDA